MRYSDDDGDDREPRDDEPIRDASGVTITGAHQAVPRTPAAGPPEASLDDWSFVRGTTPDPELPHWTEAPTGQVPAVLARDDDRKDAGADDPWSSVPSPTWRQDETDWTAHDEAFEPAMLGDEGGSAPVHDDDARRPWEFDSDDADEPVLAVTSSTRPATRVRARDARARRASESPLRGRAARPASTRDMPVAIFTGLVLGILVLVAFDVSTVLFEILSVIVVTVAAGEAFSAMRTAGHRPAAALGLVASLSLMVATYNKGLAALPLVAGLCFFFTFLWFLGGVEHADVVDGVGTSMLVFVWVGVLGSFAGLLLAPTTFPNRAGVHFLLGAIILAVANDVGALATGKLLGRRPLARHISPNKTWEGAIGAAIVTVLAALCLSALPHWTLGSALTLGILAAILVPLGDLCESMFKRSLGVKDMGRFLPGHGGFLDRVDGLLFVLPATYYVVLSFHLH